MMQKKNAPDEEAYIIIIQKLALIGTRLSSGLQNWVAGSPLKQAIKPTNIIINHTIEIIEELLRKDLKPKTKDVLVIIKDHLNGFQKEVLAQISDGLKGIASADSIIKQWTIKRDRIAKQISFKGQTLKVQKEIGKLLEAYKS